MSDDYRNSFRLERRLAHTHQKYDIGGLSALSLIPGILRFYGSFLQGAYQNIIFELEDKTLEDFFEATSPPVESQDIIDFWDQMFQLANSVSRIRGLINAGTIEFHDYRVMLAPHSIFVVSGETVSPYNWKFKLDAPGRRSTTKSGEDDFYGVFLTLVCSHN